MSRAIFENYYQQWKAFCQSDLIVLSSSDDVYINNPHFKSIVNMGEEVVPFLMEKLQTDGEAHFLIHALAQITNHQFTSEEIKSVQANYGTPIGNQAYSKLWLSWWDQQQSGQ